jgi:hypothetical protein
MTGVRREGCSARPFHLLLEDYVVDFERVSFGSGFMAEPAALFFGQHLLADFPVHSVVAFPA